MSVTGLLYRTTNDAFNIKRSVPITHTHVQFIDGNDHSVEKNKRVKEDMDSVLGNVADRVGESYLNVITQTEFPMKYVAKSRLSICSEYVDVVLVCTEDLIKVHNETKCGSLRVEVGEAMKVNVSRAMNTNICESIEEHINHVLRLRQCEIISSSPLFNSFHPSCYLRLNCLRPHT